MVIILPFGIIFLLIGYFTYQANLKAAREIELWRIQSRLAEIERLKASEGAGDAGQPSAGPRRTRPRR